MRHKVKYSKCACKVPNFENWVILYQRSCYTVVYCRGCNAKWKTEAKYINEIRERDAALRKMNQST